MNLARRIVNRWKPGGPAPKPATGRVLWPRREDAWRDYPSAGLTPSKLAAILREADAGSPGRALALAEEMEEKDAHLYAVAAKRRLALTGLEWTVVSAAEALDGVDRVQADEAAAYCRNVLADIEAFDEALQHLSLAIGRNMALAELVWDRSSDGLTLVDVVPVDFGRIVLSDLDEVRVLTRDDPTHGSPLPACKFVLHTPHSVSGHAARGGLLRVTAMVFLAKNLALKDWLVFAEIFGMPVRIARYEPSATAEEKSEMLRMLEALGSNASGIFSRAVELQFVEAGQGKAPPPYQNLVDFLNREMSKAWLGQTLTTETPGLSGTYGATKIHEEVRKDLRTDDLRKEARTIRRDILAPLARLRYGEHVPVPFFRRKVERPRSMSELTDVLDAAVNRLGVRVPRKWAHDALGIPSAGANEEVLERE